MTANTPKDPIDGVTEWTNEETGIKYRYISGAWRAVSSKAAEDLAEIIEGVDLEQVLENGNIADESIVLTNGSNDALLLSPEEARIMVGGIGEDVVPRVELRHDTGTQDTSIVKLELDEDGERFDIECDEKVDNIHFRFEDDVKFDLNKKGDAVFSGKVQVEPGTEGNEAVTYNQLVEIEEELESLVPSIERGQFDILLTDIQGGDEGYFNMLQHFTEAMSKEEEAKCKQEYDVCQRNPDLDAIDCEADFTRCKTRIPQVGTGYYPTDEFANVIRLKFAYYDVNGITHNWESLKPGQLIDVFNMEDDSYMLAEVTGVSGMWYAGVDIDVKVLQFKGKATGRCRIKVFELDLNAGSDVDFIRKQGSNQVEDNWKITSDASGGKTHFHVQDGESKIYWLQDPSSDQHPVTLKYANNNYFQIDKRNQTKEAIWIRPENEDGDVKGGAGIGNMLVVNQESGEQGSIVRIQQGGEDCLKVEVNKRVNMFHNIVKDLGDPRTNDDGKKDAVNRQYVDKIDADIRKYIDDKVAELTLDSYTPAPYSWKRENRDEGNPTSGYWYIDSKEKFLYLSSMPQEGVRLNSTGFLDDTGANQWNGTRVQCAMWKKSGSSYVIAQTFEAQKYRTSYAGGGSTTSTTIFQLEVYYPKINWSDIDKSVRYWISIPGLL